MPSAKVTGSLGLRLEEALGEPGLFTGNGDLFSILVLTKRIESKLI